MDIGEDEFDNDEGGVSGVAEAAQEADDGDGVVDVDMDEGSHCGDWDFEGDLCCANPGTGDVVEFGSGTGVLEVEAAALTALRETMSLG